MADFAKYAFNKSHAAAYATLTYQTAYLKRYYMLELFAAVINNRITKSDEIAKYLAYVKNYDKKIYPPDINKSTSYLPLKTTTVCVSDSAVSKTSAKRQCRRLSKREEPTASTSR